MKNKRIPNLILKENQLQHMNPTNGVIVRFLNHDNSDNFKF